MQKDYLIQGGTIYDGSGAKPFQSDLLIREGRIAAIGEGLAAADAEIISAAGRVVTPGFVDLHRHCDVAPITQPEFGQVELAQGITSTFVGNCGLAPVPMTASTRKELCDFLEPITGPIPETFFFADYKSFTQALRNAGLPLNMGFLAAAGSIKIATKGGFHRAPYTSEELRNAAAFVEQAMEAGAFGVSLGIMYQPECYSTIDELVQVVRPAAQKDGLLCAHIRGEGDSLIDSVKEVIEVAKRAGLRLNISHFKATGIHNWRDKIFLAIEQVEAARAQGLDVTADFYPYDGGSTTLQSLLPPTMLESSNELTMRKLSTPEGKARLRQELHKVHVGWDNMAVSIGWERILISSVTLSAHLHMQGRSIAVLAQEGGFEPSDFIAELLATENGKVGIIVLSMSQEDVDDIARLPYTALISDSLYGGGGNPHPRLYGSFPKFLREYVRERRILPMEQAIHKMTEMPAQRIGLKERGRLAAGYIADVLVFDPSVFCDHAAYTGTHLPATGMELVLLGGTPVLANGLSLPGRNGLLLQK